MLIMLVSIPSCIQWDSDELFVCKNILFTANALRQFIFKILTTIINRGVSANTSSFNKTKIKSVFYFKKTHI